MFLRIRKCLLQVTCYLVPFLGRIESRGLRKVMIRTLFASWSPYVDEKGICRRRRAYSRNVTETVNSSELTLYNFLKFFAEVRNTVELKSEITVSNFAERPGVLSVHQTAVFSVFGDGGGC